MQYPEAQELFQTDMRVIRNFISLVAPEQLFMLTEMEGQNRLELEMNRARQAKITQELMEIIAGADATG